MKGKRTLAPPTEFRSVKNFLPPSKRESMVDIAMQQPAKKVARVNCPVSKALTGIPEVTLAATLAPA